MLFVSCCACECNTRLPPSLPPLPPFAHNRYDDEDLEADVAWMAERCETEGLGRRLSLPSLLDGTLNPFRSLKKDVVPGEPLRPIQTNMHVHVYEGI